MTKFNIDKEVQVFNKIFLTPRDFIFCQYLLCLVLRIVKKCRFIRYEQNYAVCVFTYKSVFINK